MLVFVHPTLKDIGCIERVQGYFMCCNSGLSSLTYSECLHVIKLESYVRS